MLVLFLFKGIIIIEVNKKIFKTKECGIIATLRYHWLVYFLHHNWLCGVKCIQASDA